MRTGNKNTDTAFSIGSDSSFRWSGGFWRGITLSYQVDQQLEETAGRRTDNLDASPKKVPASLEVRPIAPSMTW